MVDPVADEDEDVWAIIDDGCKSFCHVEVWRPNAEAKMNLLHSSHLVTAKSHDFQWRWDERKAENSHRPTIEEPDMVIPGCVHSHEVLEKTHPLLVFQGGRVGK